MITRRTVNEREAVLPELAPTPARIQSNVERFKSACDRVIALAGVVVDEIRRGDIQIPENDAMRRATLPLMVALAGDARQAINCVMVALHAIRPEPATRTADAPPPPDGPGGREPFRRSDHHERRPPRRKGQERNDPDGSSA
jgi:hypothetical protein